MRMLSFFIKHRAIGENFSNGNNTLISGSDLLTLAINKVKNTKGDRWKVRLPGM